MVRGSLFAALTALLVLSSSAAFAQRESEERALRDQFADRDEYRTKLLLELQRRETLLVRQQKTLATQEERLQALYQKLGQPVSDDEDDAGAQQANVQLKGAAGQKLAPETSQGRRAKDVEAQIYKTNLARYNVAHTQKDIAELKALLARNPQRP
jgi:hypothetical protein